MAQIPGTSLIAPIVPFDSQDVFPTHKAVYGAGGVRTVDDLTERDAITQPRREEGMLVWVKDSDGFSNPKMYQLVGGITNTDWIVFTVGAAGTTWTFNTYIIDAPLIAGIPIQLVLLNTPIANSESVIWDTRVLTPDGGQVYPAVVPAVTFDYFVDIGNKKVVLNAEFATELLVDDIITVKYQF